MNIGIIDIEANGFYDDVDTIWLAVYSTLHTGDFTTLYGNGIYNTDEDTEALTLQRILNRTDLLIGHNIIDYDLPVLNKLWGIGYNGAVFDTYVASTLRNPDMMGGHSLENWGKKLGFFKTEFNDFSKWSPDMVDYCKQDVRLTEKVYDAIKSEFIVGAGHSRDNVEAGKTRSRF